MGSLIKTPSTESWPTSTPNHYLPPKHLRQGILAAICFVFSTAGVSPDLLSHVVFIIWMIKASSGLGDDTRPPAEAEHPAIQEANWLTPGEARISENNASAQFAPLGPGQEAHDIGHAVGLAGQGAAETDLQ
ncbi:hypothetical protein PG987_006224 [Apiospora arundinis]